MIRSSLLFFVLLLFACERDACSGVGRNGVCIQIVNQSGQRVVKTILIAPERHTHRKINKTIGNGDETTVSYKTAGESSYQLVFIMENGDTIRSREGYAEGGYTFKEVIRKNKVVSSLKDY